MKSLRILLLSTLVFLAGLPPVTAHSIDQYRMEMAISPKRVAIKVMSTLIRPEEQAKARGDGLDETPSIQVPSSPSISMTVDGKPLEWKESPPHEVSGDYGEWLEYDALYTFEQEPAHLRLSLAPGDRASFVVVIQYPDGKIITELLSVEKPLEVAMGGAEKPARAVEVAKAKSESTSPESLSSRSSAVFGNYVEHGIWHILTGYDHMLFMAALVLAVVSFWDLVKVGSAFTLAHTITLTLSILDIVRLNERIVEPMIAASIVFVALQNIFAPNASRGWTRLAVAFGFGLFHGLGFAGGLLDAMAGLSGLTVVTAIVAFSLGVELGHQFVVVPLYITRRLIHRTSDPKAYGVSRMVTLIGSALISLAGTYYLVVSLFP